MIKIHVAEFTGAAIPCIADLQKAQTEAELDAKYEQALADLRAIDAPNEDINVILEKVDNAARIKAEKDHQQSTIDRILDLLKTGVAALDNDLEHLIIPDDLAIIIAPYREGAVEQLLDTFISTGGDISSVFNEGYSRDDLLTGIKAHVAA